MTRHGGSPTTRGLVGFVLGSGILSLTETIAGNYSPASFGVLTMLAAVLSRDMLTGRATNLGACTISGAAAYAVHLASHVPPPRSIADILVSSMALVFAVGFVLDCLMRGLFVLRVSRRGAEGHARAVLDGVLSGHPCSWRSHLMARIRLARGRSAMHDEHARLLEDFGAATLEGTPY